MNRPMFATMKAPIDPTARATKIIVSPIKNAIISYPSILPQRSALIKEIIPAIIKPVAPGTNHVTMPLIPVSTTEKPLLPEACPTHKRQMARARNTNDHHAKISKKIFVMLINIPKQVSKTKIINGIRIMLNVRLKSNITLQMQVVFITIAGFNSIRHSFMLYLKIGFW